MHRDLKKLFKTILITAFLGVLTFVSFEKEKLLQEDVETNMNYSDAELNAEIVSNTAPETVKHTDTNQIRITVKNCGTVTWSKSEDIRLCIWQDEYDWGYRVNLPDDVEVQKGEQYTFIVENFVLPEASRTKLEFQMVKEGITYFGEREAVEITAVE